MELLTSWAVPSESRNLLSTDDYPCELHLQGLSLWWIVTCAVPWHFNPQNNWLWKVVGCLPVEGNWENKLNSINSNIFWGFESESTGSIFSQLLYETKLCFILISKMKNSSLLCSSVAITSWRLLGILCSFLDHFWKGHRILYIF